MPNQTYDQAGVLYDEPSLPYDGAAVIVSSPAAAPPAVASVASAVPTWHVELAVISVLDHAFAIGTSTVGGSDVLGGGLSPAFQDITADTKAVTIRRGRTANLDQMAQGTLTLKINDPNGKYNPQGGYPNAVLADQPAAFWHLDEVSGSTTAVDSSGQGNYGTYNGTFTFQVPGPWLDGTAGATLDGSTAYISVSNINIQGIMAVEAWFKTSSAAKQYLIEKAPVTTNWGLFINSGNLSWLGGSATAVSTTGTNYADGNWHQVFVVQNGTTATIYVDGAQAATGTVAALGNANNTIYIGAAKDASANFFSGSLDGVALFTHSVTAARISAHYAARNYYGWSITPMLPVRVSADFYDYETAVTNDSPALQLRMNDAVLGTTAADGSSNANNATVTGNVLFQQMSEIVDSSPSALFDGLTGYLSVSWISAYAFTNAFSAECWVNFVALQTGHIAAQFKDGNNGWALSLQANGDGNYLLKFTVAVAGVLAVQYSGPVSVASWYHVVGTFDGSNARLYVNNTLYGPTALVGSLSLSTSTVYVGSREGSTNFASAYIDEVALYGKVLSAARVQAHYQAGVGNGGDTKNFKLYYGFTDRPEEDPDAARQEATITAIDMFELYNLNMPAVLTQYAQRVDQILTTILNKVPVTDPNFISFDQGNGTIAAWGDGVQGNKSALALFQDLLATDMGLAFINGAGATVYKNRANRYTQPVPVAIWDGSILGSGTKPTADKQLIFNQASASRQYTQQTFTTSGAPTGGNVVLLLDGQLTATIAYNAAASAIQTAFQNLSNVGTAGVVCTGGPLGTAPVVCNFTGQRPAVTLSANNLTGGTSPSLTLSSTQVANQYGTGQQLNTTGSPTGGTFTISVNGAVTSNLNYNATAGQVATALQALGNIGSSGVTTAGGPLGTTPVTCTFTSIQPLMQLVANSLTGGTNPSITTAITSPTNFQVVGDTPSQKRYGLRPFGAVQSYNWTTDTDAQSWAEYIVFLNKDSRPPLRSATIVNGPGKAVANEAPKRLWQILNREINDAVLINMAGDAHGAGSYSQGTIQSIQIDAQQGGRIVTGSYTVQPALVLTSKPFVVGTSNVGSQDVLGY